TAIFMVYNNPPFAVVARKSRGVTAPRDLEGKKLGAPTADGAYAQWPIFVKANNIDAAKVEIVNVGFAVREPMLVSGQVDAINGFSFSSYINVKHSGIPQEDIVVLLLANYGVSLYGNSIMVNPFRRRQASSREGISSRLSQGPQGQREGSLGCNRVRDQTQR